VFELGKKVAVLYIQQSDVEMIEPALGVDLVMCVCTGCNDPERVNSESLDSTNFIRALENNQHMCAKHWLLTDIH